MLETLIVWALGIGAAAWVYCWPIWWRSKHEHLKPGQVFEPDARGRMRAVYRKTPMQEMFTNEEIGIILKYKIRWTSVEHAKRMIEAVRRAEAR
jgi:hypothetical protein